MRFSLSKTRVGGAIESNGLGVFLKKVINVLLPNRATLDIASTKSHYCNYYALKDEYAKKVCDFNNKDFSNDKHMEDGIGKKYIWTLWLQGEENAPDIVKACWQSVRRNIPEGYELVILDQNKIKKYVKMPEYIEAKYLKKQITMAHYSDLLRLQLLIRYGGYWIDSTVYCTNQSLFNYLVEADVPLFAYKSIMRNEDWSALSNWFIYAKKNNNILRNVYMLLLDYWKTNDSLKDYFVFHIFFKIVTERLSEEWDAVPLLSNVSPHLLSCVLFKCYDEKYFKFLGHASSLHKLTYKNKVEDINKPGTYYQHIIQNKC